MLSFLPELEGPEWAVWTTDNSYRFDTSRGRVLVADPARHPYLRARFGACPVNLPGCVAKKYFRISVPQNGELVLHFPGAAAPVMTEFRRDPGHPLYLLFLLLLATAVGTAYTGPTRWLGLLTLASSGFYFSFTMGKERAMDLYGHINHVERIASEGLFVKAGNCWECFQPPLYYLGSALLMGFPERIGSPGMVQLQGLSLLFQLLSVPLIFGTVARFTDCPRRRFWCTALVALWPASVFHSVRLGNDGLLNLIAFGSVYFLCRQRFLPGAGLASLSLLVKASGIVGCAVAGAVLLRELWLRRISGPKGAVSALLLGAGFGAERVLRSWKQHDPLRLAALDPRMRVDNSWAELLGFHPLAFLREAFVNPWIPSVSRDLLPNYFWKTSLFGEWGFQYPGAQGLGRLSSLLLLVLLGWGLRVWLREASERYLPAVLAGAAFAAVLGYRLSFPFACNADFRFVYPAASLALSTTLAQSKGKLAAHGFQLLIPGFLLCFQALLLVLWFFERG